MSESTGMNRMARLRLHLRADPSELASFDGEAALERARARLRDSRDDVQVTYVELLSPNAVGVVLLTGPVSVEDIDDIAANLRAALEIEPGFNRLMPDSLEGVRGIGGGESRGVGGEETECPACGIPGGGHLRGCPLSGAG
jgi:hypothetical protein